MSKRHDPRTALDHTAPGDTAREWHDQERALREERLGLSAAHAEPRVAHYRLLARILREPAQDALPHDFAALVAARAEAATRMAGDRVDLRVQRVLLTLFGLTGTALVGGDVAAWLHRVFASTGSPDGDPATTTVRWLFAIGACGALSYLIDLWTAHAARRHTRLRSRV